MADFGKFKVDTGAGALSAKASTLSRYSERMRSDRSLNKLRKSIEAKTRSIRSEAAVGYATEKKFDDAVDRVSGKAEAGSLSIRMGAKRDQPEVEDTNREDKMEDTISAVSTKLGVTGVQG